MRTAIVWIVAGLLVSVLPGSGQEKKESDGAKIYKVEFNIRDGSDAAAKTGRRYTMLVETGSRGTFRVGDKLPYATGSFQPGIGGVGVNPLVNTQYTYLDTGVRIECRLREWNEKVVLNADIDISTVVQHDKAVTNNPPNPTVASILIGGISAAVDPGKSALVASIEDPVTMRKVDVTATVTKVN